MRGVCSLSLSLSLFFLNRALLRVNARKASSSRIRSRVAFVVERVYVCVRVYVLYSVCARVSVSVSVSVSVRVTDRKDVRLGQHTGTSTKKLEMVVPCSTNSCGETGGACGFVRA